jgi:hypothetical protein
MKTKKSASVNIGILREGGESITWGGGFRSERVFSCSFSGLTLVLFGMYCIIGLENKNFQSFLSYY